MTIKKNWLFVAILLLFIALVDSAYLTYHHHLVNIVHPDSASFCTFNSVIDCDEVALSNYATLLDFPVSSLGLFAYLFVGILLFIGLNLKPEGLVQVSSLVFTILLIMLLFTLYEASMSIMMLNKICMMCSILYACIIGLVLCMKKANDRPISEIFSISIKAIISAFAWSQSKVIFWSGMTAFVISAALAFTWDYQIQSFMLHKRVESDITMQDGLQAGLNFLNQNKSASGVISLPSGLQYKIIQEGTGQKPKADSLVTVHYKGTLIDGTEFNNSYQTNQPITFGLGSVIAGWKEGIGMMKSGGKRIFYIPHNLAYGRNSMGKLIPKNSTLIFEIELLGVVD